MIWPFSSKPAAMEVKEHPAGVALFIPGATEWQRPKNRAAYIREGYHLNVIVYRAVAEIARAVGDLEIEVVNAKGDIIENHPALQLLSRPNPTQGGDGLLRDLFTFYLILGEMACVRYPEAGRPAELWCLSPEFLDVKPGRGGIASAYVYEQNNSKLTFQVKYPSGQCQVFFQKMHNPADYWRGQSPLFAASLAADTHNAGLRWNYSVLKNSARPSGLIQMGEGAGGEIVARLKEWFKAALQGERNAGEIPVLPHGTTWMPMSENAKDMDFINTMKEAAKLIASAYGVPLPLIDNDASTFNNLEQAKERLYTDTVLPLAREFLSQFGNWLLPFYGEGLRFQINEDKIGALEGIRTRLYERMAKAVQAGILTVDEAREALGYDPLGDDDMSPDDLAAAAAAIGYGKPKEPEPEEDDDEKALSAALLTYLAGDNAQRG
jgi:HK97 family phage portal protein